MVGLLPRLAGMRRSFSGDASEMLMEAWKKAKTPLSLLQPRPAVPGSIPSKLTLNLYLPHSPQLSNSQVDMVIVPATSGQMGILPGHLATMTELNPGVMSVHKGASETTKYFISGGFAFVHPNSVADIVALEAVPIERIEPGLVHEGLAHYSQKLNSAVNDYERAEAKIGVDVHTALLSALNH